MIRDHDKILLLFFSLLNMNNFTWEKISNWFIGSQDTKYPHNIRRFKRLYRDVIPFTNLYCLTNMFQAFYFFIPFIFTSLLCPTQLTILRFFMHFLECFSQSVIFQQILSKKRILNLPQYTPLLESNHPRQTNLYLYDEDLYKKIETSFLSVF